MTASSPGAALSARDLDQFRKVQRLAYDCAETVARDLTPGLTERQVAGRMRDWLLDHGVDDWFHKPFAWFGDRTAFEGFIGFKHLGGFNPAFYPGNRRLEEGMPFILDCAPSQHGYTADIGYCGVLGENKLLDKLMDDLLEYHMLILDLVRQRRPLAGCWTSSAHSRSQLASVGDEFWRAQHRRAGARPFPRWQRRLVADLEQQGVLGTCPDPRAVGGGAAPGLSWRRRQVGGTAGGDRG